MYNKMLDRYDHITKIGDEAVFQKEATENTPAYVLIVNTYTKQITKRYCLNNNPIPLEFDEIEWCNNLIKLNSTCSTHISATPADTMLRTLGFQVESVLGCSKFTKSKRLEDKTIETIKLEFLHNLKKVNITHLIDGQVQPNIILDINMLLAIIKKCEEYGYYKYTITTSSKEEIIK